MRRFAAFVTPWIVVCLVLVGCRSTPENRDPTGARATLRLPA